MLLRTLTRWDWLNEGKSEKICNIIFLFDHLSQITDKLKRKIVRKLVVKLNIVINIPRFWSNFLNMGWQSF